MKNLSLISACLLLGACGSTSGAPRQRPGRASSGATWRPGAAMPATSASGGRPSARRNWTACCNALLLNSRDLGAAVARVRQAQASAVIAGAPLLPELNATLGASRAETPARLGLQRYRRDLRQRCRRLLLRRPQRQLRSGLRGGRRAAYRSALESLKASEYDRATVELTLLSGVASYLQVLALREQRRIARLNLDNAEHVLRLVATRHAAGSATVLEVAQQSSLVASQRRQPRARAAGP
ncbi:TolC family protein [Pseudomonas aeruginosa]